MLKYTLSTAFLFFVIIGQSQVTNLGTTFFRNEQYLISFEKNMYPGYQLVLENIHVREYLYNQLISDSLYTDKLNFIEIEGSEKRFEQDIMAPNGVVITLKNGNEYALSAEFDFSNDYKILNERYNELEETGYFEKYVNSQIPVKRLSNANNTVEEVLINFDIDYQTNKINRTESVLASRPMKSNEIADIDQNIYTITKVGSQVWISENLRTTKFNDGTPIPTLTDAQWMISTAPALLSNDPDGNYYNFYTLVADKNVCPQGFHVPDESDMEVLYNGITPYGDELKINTNGIKFKSYSPLLAPITYPLASAVHVAWWSTALAVDAGLMSVALASDAAKFGLELVTSPFFGWQTKTKQYRNNLKEALEIPLIDQYGMPLSYNKDEAEFERRNLNPINKSDWAKFNLIHVNYPLEFGKPHAPTFENGQFTDENTSKFSGDTLFNTSKIDSLKALYVDYAYKTKFKPFYNRFSVTKWFVNSDYFTEYNGLFGAFNFSAYQDVSYYGYPEEKISFRFENKTLKSGRIPVLALLLSEGNKEFSNQFGFNLNHDNDLVFISRNKPYSSRSTGISYVNHGYPAYFGLSYKNGKSTHELDLFEDLFLHGKTNQMDEFKTQTRIRCVQD